MTPYKPLECPNYTKINNAILDYIKNHTNLINTGPDPKARYCNFVDTKHFITNNPLLYSYFNELGLKLKDIYFTLAWYTRTLLPLHLDRPPVQWKMNWPVLNMENTAVRFFDLKDKTQNIHDYVRRFGIAGSKDQDHYVLSYQPFVEIDRYRFDTNQPLIMNGQVAHDVYFYDGVQFPRVGMQAMFYEEPVHLL